MDGRAGRKNRHNLLARSSSVEDRPSASSLVSSSSSSSKIRRGSSSSSSGDGGGSRSGGAADGRYSSLAFSRGGGGVAARRQLELEFQGFCKIGQWQRALQQFEKLLAFQQQQQLRRGGEKGGSSISSSSSSRKGLLPASMYTSLIESFQRRGGPSSEAEKVIALMEEHGVRPTMDSYDALSRVYEANRDWESSLKLWLRMRNEGGSSAAAPYPQTYGSIIRCCRYGGAEGRARATEIFASMGRDLVRPTTAVYNAMILTADDPEKVLPTLSQMEAMRVPCDEKTYAHALRILAASNYSRSVDKVMDMMENDNDVRATSIVYEALIKGFGKSLCHPQVVDAWEAAEQNNVSLVATPASSKVRKLALTAALRTNHWALALRVFKQLETPPGLMLSNAMISCLSANDQSVEALMLFKVTYDNDDSDGGSRSGAKEDEYEQKGEGEAREAFSSSSSAAILRVIHSLLASSVRTRTPRVALEVLDVAERKELPLDEFAFSSTIAACARGEAGQRRRQRRAAAVSKEQEEEEGGNSKGVKPGDEEEFFPDSSGIGYGYEQALSVLERMKSRSSSSSSSSSSSLPPIVPTTRAYNPLLHAVPTMAEAQRLLEEMAASPHPETKPNRVSFVSLISAAARLKDMDAAHRMFQRMMDEEGGEGSCPGIYAYNALMSGYLRTGLCQEAERLLEDMKKAKGENPKAVAPDVRTFTAAIGSCLKTRNWGKALEFLGELKEAADREPSNQDIQPSVKTYF
eukprot:jgi/Bigna1/138612/aug1.45_g13320